MDTHTLTLTTREVEMLLGALDLMGSVIIMWRSDLKEIIALEVKITQQTGVK